MPVDSTSTRRVRGDSSRKRTTILCGLLAIAVLAWSSPGVAAARRPRVVPLPDGFQPEGIATRGPTTFFVGSIPTGAIYRGNLKTGRGGIFVPAQEGRSAIGLGLRAGMLFVAGGQTGQAYVYNAATGEEVGVFQLTSEQTFVNDVDATEDAAYFTDSVNPVVYKLPIEGPGDLGTPETIPITGDLVYTDGFNANGIDSTPNGVWLVVVQSNTGRLFRVDPENGASTEIDLGGETVPNGDGILLDRERRLWVLQNQDNLLTRVRVAADLSSGEIRKQFTHRRFDVPTTLARSRHYLAIVNARFGTESPETTEYWVTQIRRAR
jgi:sugar lactone lactonase YvrE